MPRVIVIGLDGASWDFLGPCTEAGELPTLRELVAGGVCGVLESCTPAVTFPAWKCYSTGRNPGKLGVYWWTRVDFDRRSITVNDSTSFHGSEIWDYLGQSGYRSLVVNLPSTYPPRPIRGVMIAGHPVPRESGYTYPLDLEDELRRRFSYRVEPKIGLWARRGLEDLEAVRTLIRLRFAVAKEYGKDVEFLHLTVFLIDAVQHFYWHDHDVMLKFYKVIDSELADLLSTLGADSIVLLISDHGFGPSKGVFYINSWLVQRGYLSKRRNIGKMLQKVGLTKERVASMARRFGVDSVVTEMVPKAVLKAALAPLPGESLESEKEQRGRSIDWNRTTVIASGEGPIYINTKEVHKERRYELLRDELITELERVKHPATGEPVIAKVLRREQIYSGPFLDQAPDLVALPQEGYEICGNVRPDDKLWGFEAGRQRGGTWTGNHRREGIFSAWGPGIRRGVKLRGTTIFDICPTILHIFGLPIEKDLDGRVLMEIFEEGSDLAARETPHVDTAQEGATGDIYDSPMSEKDQQEIRRRLNGLGYL